MTTSGNFLFAVLCGCHVAAAASGDSRLPDGTEYQAWERPLQFSKTYYVDAHAANADDAGPGSRTRPFRTISKAALILQPGERVVIAEGVYRESVHPTRGGSGPDKMISYEAAPGANVVVKGSLAVRDGWKPSEGWWLTFYRAAYDDPDLRDIPVVGDPKVYSLALKGEWFGGYNPFGMVNILHDRMYLDTKNLDMTTYLRRRGMVFVDGQPLQQVDLYRQLGAGSGRFWIEANGMTLHMRLPGDDPPERHSIELTTKEQVFAPLERGIGYIRVKGLTLEQASSGFPVPQRGLLSTSAGHHWIIEDNTVQWANSVCIDAGYQDWNATPPKIFGKHVIRRNTVRQRSIGGIQAFGATDLLIEDNLVEHCGGQTAEEVAESAGVKLHLAKNLLFRRNVIRHIVTATGLWLDADNANCRITRNIIAEIRTARAAIHIEASHEANQIDNNIIWGIKQMTPSRALNSIREVVPPGRGGWGILDSGSDYLLIAHNLIMNVDTCGFFVNPYPQRIIFGRGGTVRENRLLNNIIGEYGEAAITFPNEHNFADGNLYLGRLSGFLRLLGADIPQWLDLKTWREFHGWDIHGSVSQAQSSFDPDALTLRLSVKDAVSNVAAVPTASADFFGQECPERRLPGPFATLPSDSAPIKVDPRVSRKGDQ